MIGFKIPLLSYVYPLSDNTLSSNLNDVTLIHSVGFVIITVNGEVN